MFALSCGLQTARRGRVLGAPGGDRGRAVDAATLNGILNILQAFKASAGEKFAILGSSALTGKFKKVKGNKIKKTN